MKKEEIRITYQVFANEGELPELFQRVYQSARGGLALSYSPYSHFKVGAAVLLENGELLNAGNVENAAYPMCLCAERTLLAAVDSTYPDKAIRAMAITIEGQGPNLSKPAAPCGACRQVLSEKEDRLGQAIPLLLRGETGPFYLFPSCGSLLPLAFSGSFLIA